MSPHAESDPSEARPSEIDRAPLSVLLDVRHPLSYLALPSTLELARELAIDVNWLPIVTPPLKAPSTPAPDDDRGIRHRRARAQAIGREIATYAEVRGLVLHEYYRDPDPQAFVLAWLWMRDRHPERLEAFLLEGFRSYWSLELDPSSRDRIASLIDSIGGDGSGYRAWCAGPGPAAVEALAEELRERGLGASPCYVVEDEVFQGRQHLPMIRWILAGRVGPGPI